MVLFVASPAPLSAMDKKARRRRLIGRSLDARVTPFAMRSAIRGPILPEGSAGRRTSGMSGTLAPESTARGERAPLEIAGVGNPRRRLDVVLQH
ncbi:hypothetical protein WME79_10820 [Sorangium sp. So ce726]|uniref:hypothetical protein n=1 Tax=Sorangium sp. So ce726 TaxID=3133319 RepID=UPI003F5E751F